MTMLESVRRGWLEVEKDGYWSVFQSPTIGAENEVPVILVPDDDESFEKLARALAEADGAPNPAPGWKVQEYRRRLKAVLGPTDPEPTEESDG